MCYNCWSWWCLPPLTWCHMMHFEQVFAAAWQLWLNCSGWCFLSHLCLWQMLVKDGSLYTHLCCCVSHEICWACVSVWWVVLASGILCTDHCQVLQQEWGLYTLTDCSPLLTHMVLKSSVQIIFLLWQSQVSLYHGTGTFSVEGCFKNKSQFSLFTSWFWRETEISFWVLFSWNLLYSRAAERRSIIIKSCLLVNSVTCIGETPILKFHPVTRQ